MQAVRKLFKPKEKREESNSVENTTTESSNQEPKTETCKSVECLKNATDKGNSNWAILPTDVKWIIFNYTDEDLAGLYRSRRVCQDWKKTIEGFTEFWEQQAK